MKRISIRTSFEHDYNLMVFFARKSVLEKLFEKVIIYDL